MKESVLLCFGCFTFNVSVHYCRTQLNMKRVAPTVQMGFIEASHAVPVLLVVLYSALNKPVHPAACAPACRRGVHLQAISSESLI